MDTISMSYEDAKDNNIINLSKTYSKIEGISYISYLKK
jgi:hypothetical protein